MVFWQIFLTCYCLYESYDNAWEMYVIEGSWKSFWWLIGAIVSIKLDVIIGWVIK